MAVVSDLSLVSVVCKLNNGTTDNGQLKTLDLSLGKMDIDRYDDDKAMAIVNLLRPCLAKDVVEVRKVAVSVLSSSN